MSFHFGRSDQSQQAIASFIPHSASPPHTGLMKNLIAALVAAVGVAGALGMGVEPVAAQDGRCLDRREIQEKIDSGELIQLSQAMDEAGVDGKIISSAAQVCEVDGQWQWRVNVMDSSGESRPVTLPAQ